MDVLVTGGAGFIGSHFVKYLLNNPEVGTQISKVTVLDALTYAGDMNRLKSVISDPRFDFVHGDINNSKLVNQLIANKKYVFNFAAESHVDRSIIDPHSFLHSNVTGVQVLLDCILENPDVVLVHVSTDEVYGEVLEGSSVETDRLVPSSPYSASKAAAEMLIVAAERTHGVAFKITRGCNTYGPGQYPEKIIPYFIELALQGKDLTIYGDGLQTREWLHVEDHARGIWLTAINGDNGEIYNLGSGVELSNLYVANLITQLVGSSSTETIHVNDRKGHDRRYSIDSSKSREKLGFNARINFEEQLKTLIESRKVEF